MADESTKEKGSENTSGTADHMGDDVAAKKTGCGVCPCAGYVSGGVVSGICARSGCGHDARYHYS